MLLDEPILFLPALSLPYGPGTGMHPCTVSRSRQRLRLTAWKYLSNPPEMVILFYIPLGGGVNSKLRLMRVLKQGVEKKRRESQGEPVIGMLLLLVVVVAVGALAYSYYRRQGGRGIFPSNTGDALEIARRRYARGEISRQEFEEIKRDLEEEGGRS